jgi:hypothetical protein
MKGKYTKGWEAKYGLCTYITLLSLMLSHLYSNKRDVMFHEKFVVTLKLRLFLTLGCDIIMFRVREHET